MVSTGGICSNRVVIGEVCELANRVSLTMGQTFHLGRPLQDPELGS